jgi:hypothetical protein
VQLLRWGGRADTKILSLPLDSTGCHKKERYRYSYNIPHSGFLLIDDCYWPKTGGLVSVKAGDLPRMLFR